MKAVLVTILIFVFVLAVFAGMPNDGTWPTKPPLGVKVNPSTPYANGLVMAFLFSEGKTTFARNVANDSMPGVLASGALLSGV